LIFFQSYIFNSILAAKDIEMTSLQKTLALILAK